MTGSTNDGLYVVRSGREFASEFFAAGCALWL